MSDKPALSPLVTVLAGQKLTAQLHGGHSLEVFVRQMPARFIVTRYLAFIGQEAEMLEHICQSPAGSPDLPTGWVDALTPESHLALVEAAHAVNFKLAVAQFERETAAMKEVAPISQQVRSLLSSLPAQR